MVGLCILILLRGVGLGILLIKKLFWGRAEVAGDADYSFIVVICWIISELTVLKPD